MMEEKMTASRAGSIRERAANTKNILRLIKDALKDAVTVGPDMLHLIQTTGEIRARVNRMQNIDEIERNTLMGALVLQAATARHMREELMKLAEEYEHITNVVDPEHRKFLIETIGHAKPEEIPRIRKFMRYISAAKKEHAATLVEKAQKYGIEKVIPLAREYYHGSPEEKEVIAHIIKHVKNEDHIQRAQYHVRAIKNMHEGIKKQLPKVLKEVNSFEEVDQIMMAAHHASQSIRAGGKEEDILSAFRDKKTAIERFGRPARGWEPYAPRNREIR